MTPLWNQIARGALSNTQLVQIDRYLDLLIEKNKVLNLTRITDRADAEVKHVADALTLLPLIPGSAQSLADVGTGGGIPGVILAIARPGVSVTLVDSTRKKLDAVKGMCDTIGLTNVHTLHARIEAVDQKFDVVTARAVAELETLLGWCEGLMSRSSLLLALKGPKADEEIADLSPHRRRRWRVEVRDVEVPELDGHRIVSGRYLGH